MISHYSSNREFQLVTNVFDLIISNGYYKGKLENVIHDIRSSDKYKIILIEDKSGKKSYIRTCENENIKTYSANTLSDLICIMLLEEYKNLNNKELTDYLGFIIPSLCMKVSLDSVISRFMYHLFYSTKFFDVLNKSEVMVEPIISSNEQVIHSVGIRITSIHSEEKIEFEIFIVKNKEEILKELQCIVLQDESIEYNTFMIDLYTNLLEKILEYFRSKLPSNMIDVMSLLPTGCYDFLVRKNLKKSFIMKNALKLALDKIVEVKLC